MIAETKTEERAKINAERRGEGLLKDSIAQAVRTGREGTTLGIPIYSDVKPGQCARWTRFAAEDLFGKVYDIKDAWDRKYDSRVDVIPINGVPLIDMAKNGLLQPGDLIGIYNPLSPARFTYTKIQTPFGKTLKIPNGLRKDERGDLVHYTHSGLYVGDHIHTEEPLIAHLVGKVFVEDEDQIRKRWMSPVHIFRLREN